MTQFYALKRYQREPIHWDVVLLWSLLIGAGATELVLAVVGAWHMAIFIKAWWGQ